MLHNHLMRRITLPLTMLLLLALVACGGTETATPASRSGAAQTATTAPWLPPLRLPRLRPRYPSRPHRPRNLHRQPPALRARGSSSTRCSTVTFRIRT